MASIVRTLLAGLAGVVSAFVTVAAVEAANNLLFPRGAAPAVSDKAAVAAYVASMPPSAFLGIALAWFLAVLAGTLVAVSIARRQPRAFALVVGGVIALSAVLNFVLIPHPAWFVALGLGAVAVATWVAMRLGARVAARGAASPRQAG